MTSSYNRYIIVGPARSGTTVTHLSLAGHPSVSALSDEVRVDPFFTRGLSTFTHSNEKKEEKEKGYLALFDAITSLHRDEKTTTLGLKTAISSCREAEAFCSSMRQCFPKVRIILTLREDIVAQFGSLERAKATGRWHSWVKPERGLMGKLALDERRLHAHALDYLRTTTELQRLKESHELFEVSYENDILPGDLRIYRQLFHFLGLSDSEVTWLKSEKVAPAPEDFISDYFRHAVAINDLRRRFESDPAALAPNPEIRTERSGLLRRMSHRLFRS